MCKRCGSEFNSMGICPACGEGPNPWFLGCLAGVTLLFATFGACSIAMIVDEKNTGDPYGLGIVPRVLLPISLIAAFFVARYLYKEWKG